MSLSPICRHLFPDGPQRHSATLEIFYKYYMKICYDLFRSGNKMTDEAAQSGEELSPVGP